MPFKKSKPHHRTAQTPSKPRVKTERHLAFLPLLVLLFIVWLVYRRLFHFPVWFDETIGKAIFFGLPVWLYINLTRSKTITETYAPERMEKGLLVGLAVGGVLGFAGALATILSKHAAVHAAPLFMSNGFWWEFFLAMMTGFWESLFFYTWIMTVIMEKFAKWPLINQVLMVSVIFLLFHIPNTILRFNLNLVPAELFLLFFFAVGQAFLFARSRNLYAVTLSHAIWGMVLLVHSR
jgi:hypothetical protein